MYMLRVLALPVSCSEIRADVSLRGLSRSLDSLSIAVGNLQSRFQCPVGIHQTPFVFPILIALVESDLPRLVECFEPTDSG